MSQIWSDDFVQGRFERARQFARKIACVPALISESIGESHQQQPVRVLRWVFRRGSESLTCKLALAQNREHYELCTVPPFPPSSTGIETFGAVGPAFSRQSEIEAMLFADGWTLELHESRLT